MAVMTDHQHLGGPSAPRAAVMTDRQHLSGRHDGQRTVSTGLSAIGTTRSGVHRNSNECIKYLTVVYLRIYFEFI